MATHQRDGADPAVRAAREARNGQILAAVITALAGVVVAVMTFLAGKDQGASQAASTSAPIATATVTVTAAATVTVTAEASPDPSRPAAAGGGHYLADLSSTGSAPIKGSRRVGDQVHKRSLGFTTGCGEGSSTTLFRLDRDYQRFQSVVAVTDAANTEDTVTFTVFADSDKDGRAGDDEEAGSVAAQADRPASLDVRLGGASQIILRVEAEACLRSVAVWGDPRVS
ncbi:NPCBM/NEW2 domain-containing protein [Nonomuraea sp. LPB2021202275-12-8]|uniref:NPCBM/NEW2 domain-containing protein n=1 Tax=Nonomuraea sp. LPB2021202275-12-8 TaxID=3120159 RepID=UPI00300D4E25